MSKGSKGVGGLGGLSFTGGRLFPPTRRLVFTNPGLVNSTPGLVNSTPGLVKHLRRFVSAAIPFQNQKM